ncbi:hypothetical protein [Novosphingobium sp. FSW06-99]|uniref:hypothetical protein n=1 Tax=Novosphingobium sp. FSW06-99 TaxID=1739113 RepID=UPI0012E3AE23|nr:hypothetical protein [Novosphingobium sp. FSW06-99]
MQTLFRVAFRHGFYNASDQRCTDLEAIPTPACATLLQASGLIFRAMDDGFGVFLPGDRAPALTAMLARQPGARLSFLLRAGNSAFVGITDLPIDMSPMRHAIHVSNLATHRQGQTREFGRADAVGVFAPLDVTDADVAFVATAAGTVSAVDLCGAPAASCTVTAPGPTTLSLAGQAYGAYTISGDPFGSPKTLVYTPQTSRAIGLIDLVLAQPTGSTAPAAAFALTIDNGQLAVNPVTLTLAFAPRATVWKYYIVSRGSDVGFAPGLTITGTNIDTGKPMTFTKSPEVLPNGDAAVLFTADAAILMRAVPTAQYALSGQRDGGPGHRADIAIARLPNAPSAPVWPNGQQPDGGISEIFVYI